MSPDSNLTAALPTLHPAADELSATAAHPRHALPGEWVRPFGDKVTALQVRRRGETRRRAAGDPAKGGSSLSTRDGTVAFHLRITPSGLLVERLQHRPVGCVLVQSALLFGSEAFRRWCDAEPIRFDDPGLHDRLRRHGDELLGRSR
jgi:hypothetical protein